MKRVLPWVFTRDAPLRHRKRRDTQEKQHDHQPTDGMSKGAASPNIWESARGKPLVGANIRARPCSLGPRRVVAAGSGSYEKVLFHAANGAPNISRPDRRRPGVPMRSSPLFTDYEVVGDERGREVVARVPPSKRASLSATQASIRGRACGPPQDEAAGKPNPRS